MNVAYKIFATILSNKLPEIMESKLGRIPSRVSAK